LPARSHSAVSTPQMARHKYEPGNLCSRSGIAATRPPMSRASRPRDHGATWRCVIVAVMSALYGDIWPHPSAPLSVVTRTNPTKRSANVSIRAILIGWLPSIRRSSRSQWSRIKVHFEHSVIPFRDARGASSMVKRAGGALLLSVAIDHASPRPVTTQLYLALREMMLAGGIAAGERLPATRTLARELGLSRTPVIEAFDRLTAEGLIEPRVGAGTYVSRALNAERPRPAPAPTAAPMRPAPRRARQPQVARAFTTALPAFDAFPMAQWARLAARHWRSHRADIMGYGDPYGLPALRRAIAAHLRQNRGIECDAEQVFVVAGAQQAFNLVGSLLLDPGDPVWFENPGAIGARNSLIASGADLVPVPVDAQGLRVDEAQARCP